MAFQCYYYNFFFLWGGSQDSYEYPGEIVILKGFEEATTDDIMRKGMSLRAKNLLKYTIHSMDIISNRSQAQTKTIF